MPKLFSLGDGITLPILFTHELQQQYLGVFAVQPLPYFSNLFVTRDGYGRRLIETNVAPIFLGIGDQEIPVGVLARRLDEVKKPHIVVDDDQQESLWWSTSQHMNTSLCTLDASLFVISTRVSLSMRLRSIFDQML